MSSIRLREETLYVRVPEVYTDKEGEEVGLAATDTIVPQVGDSLRMVSDRLE